MGIGFTIIRRLLKQKDIRVNDVRVSKDITLLPGDEVVVYTKVQSKKPMLVFDKKEITIFYKPKQISSETFRDKVAEFYGDNYQLAHRLDFNTDGLIILAKTENALKHMIDAFCKGSVQKKYLALVYGNCTLEGTFDAYITKDLDINKSYVSLLPNERSKTIRTIIKPAKKGLETTLLEIVLKTGRTHQIRAHLAFLGYPIIGDTKYGMFDVNKKFGIEVQCLTADSISFSFPQNHFFHELNQTIVKTPFTFYSNNNIAII
jgi:23S rRNA pseudouridine955/2504/2580 synthase